MDQSVLPITNDNFEAEVTQFPGVVFIDFTAPWCGPCKIMLPRIKELMQKYTDNTQVKIAEVNVDEQPELIEQFQILSVPTFKTFVNGEFDDQRIGAQPLTELEKVIENGLAKLKEKVS